MTMTAVCQPYWGKGQRCLCGTVCYAGVDSAIRGTISEIHRYERGDIHLTKTVAEGELSRLIISLPTKSALEGYKKKRNQNANRLTSSRQWYEVTIVSSYNSEFI
jgi:hypothetical protein